MFCVKFMQLRSLLPVELWFCSLTQTAVCFPWGRNIQGAVLGHKDPFFETCCVPLCRALPAVARSRAEGEGGPRVVARCSVAALA